MKSTVFVNSEAELKKLLIAGFESLYREHHKSVESVDIRIETKTTGYGPGERDTRFVTATFDLKTK